MVERPAIAGIVLAGGRSSRMGKNKALLDFRGKPLVRHMMDLMRDAGACDVFVSGSLEGYPCIEDTEVHAGPALAIKTVLKKLPGYRGYLFVPVDMPLLSINALKYLLAQRDGGYFIHWPLPAYFTPPFVQDNETSVQGFLNAQGLYPVVIPQRFESAMINVNTPQEWKEISNL